MIYHLVLHVVKPLLWRIIPFSKWLVTPIYKPFRPFGRGPTTRSLVDFRSYLGEDSWDLSTYCFMRPQHSPNEKIISNFWYRNTAPPTQKKLGIVFFPLLSLNGWRWFLIPTIVNYYVRITAWLEYFGMLPLPVTVASEGVIRDPQSKTCHVILVVTSNRTLGKHSSTCSTKWLVGG